MASIKANVEKVLGQVEKACRDAGRDRGEVRVLAATKYTDRAGVSELIRSGITMVGENRVQDAVGKLCEDGERGQIDIHEEYPGVKVHYIGHLQKNKINQALGLFDMVETIDSISLADNVSKRVEVGKAPLPVLIEVKLTDEESKTGCSEGDVLRLIEHIRQSCGNLEVRGLMGMGPWDPDPEKARPFYRRLRGIFDRIRSGGPEWERFDTVSMGMSADFQIAIQEGATLVRIGRALFE